MNIKEYVGNEILKRRKSSGFSQQDVANYLGVTRVSIINIEAGRQGVTLDNLWKLCNLLHCTPNEILPETQLEEWEYEDVEKVVYERVKKTVKVKKIKVKEKYFSQSKNK